MSLDMYNFIHNNQHKFKYDLDNGLIITPKGTNGTLCSSTGYLRVKVNNRLLQVHQVLAYKYYGDKCIDMQVNHINGNKTDNRKDNIEIVTKIENIRHANENGLIKRVNGCDHSSSKLSEEDVLFIRNSELTSSELSRIFNVARNTIFKVKNGLSYKNI